MNERYSIEVTEEVVEIFGNLTIEEAFDFLTFFEKKGYKSLVLGSENSTLRMMKRDQEEVIEKQYIIDLKEEIEYYKRSFKIEQDKHDETRSKLISVELLLKNLMSEQYEKYKKLHSENMNLLRAQCIASMEQNPEVKETLDNFGCEPPGTDIKGRVGFFDWTYTKQELIPNCCSTPEKQEQYEQLVQLKNEEVQEEESNQNYKEIDGKKSQ